MANTTFSGPVRSEDGFDVVAKNSTTGAFTTEFSLDGSGLQVTPITLGDENTTLTATANAGRTNVVPAITGNRTLTLPSPTAGSSIWIPTQIMFLCTLMVIQTPY